MPAKGADTLVHALLLYCYYTTCTHYCYTATILTKLLYYDSIITTPSCRRANARTPAHARTNARARTNACARINARARAQRKMKHHENAHTSTHKHSLTHSFPRRRGAPLATHRPRDQQTSPQTNPCPYPNPQTPHSRYVVVLRKNAMYSMPIYKKTGEPLGLAELQETITSILLHYYRH